MTVPAPPAAADASADAARRGRRAVAPAPLPGAGSATPPDPPPLARPAPERPRPMGARSRLRVVKGLHLAIVVVFLAGGFALLYAAWHAHLGVAVGLIGLVAGAGALPSGPPAAAPTPGLGPLAAPSLLTSFPPSRFVLLPLLAAAVTFALVRWSAPGP